MSNSERLAIVVIGGSGDLARKKIYPALFALFCQNRLPEEFAIFGFARSSFSAAEFRKKVAEHLTCRYTPNDTTCSTLMDQFLVKCHYHQGNYGETDSYLDLFETLRDIGGFHDADKIYYMAIPPTVFLDTAKAMANSGLVPCCDRPYWARTVIEKPFGRDRQSSDELASGMARVFTERQTYRIDHYLGKEVVQNVLAIRFANLIFEPIWNAKYVESVEIIWKENIGTSGRGGYFDQFGIIRDVVQNHLLQILAMVAMEKPASLGAKAVRDSKVEVLKAIPPVTIENARLGQYVAGKGAGGREEEGYLDDSTVPGDSLTPTFASLKLEVNNPRWRGVPFTIIAGKGADEKKNEVRIRFKPVVNNLFCKVESCPSQNELVIRVQPSEGMHLTITGKIPGEKFNFAPADLDLSYSRVYAEREIPDAYECLLLDVINGEKGLFIRDDELAAAWDIFTPLLHEIEAGKIKPEPYAFGDPDIFHS